MITGDQFEKMCTDILQFLRQEDVESPALPGATRLLRADIEQELIKKLEEGIHAQFENLHQQLPIQLHALARLLEELNRVSALVSSSPLRKCQTELALAKTQAVGIVQTLEALQQSAERDAA